jgi:exopolysaccharide biosynthesis polyprenyl glycosylphosphotransferase
MSAISATIDYRKIGAKALRPIDFALIVAGYFLAGAVAAVLNRFGLFRYPAPDEWSALPMTLVPITLISWSLVSGFGDSYVSHRDQGLPYVTGNLLRTVGLWAAVSMGAVFLAKLEYSSRQFMLEFILCAGGLILLRQVLTVLLLRRLRESGYNLKTALVLGDKSSCERFVAQANLSYPKGYRFIPINVTAAGPVGDRDRELAKSANADEIFIIGGSLGSESQDNPAVRFLRQGKAVHIVPDVIDASLFRQSLGEIGGMPVLSISCGRLTWLEELAKRTLDLVCAFLLVIVTTPVWLVTSILVSLTSRGPILFRQRRLGKDGRQFTVFKFRTMRMDAERELKRSPELYERYLANNFKLPPGEDPRLTKIGGTLRALSIDEVPQLINVIKGEMSLVGPRPIVPDEIAQYGEFAPLFLSVKPGMTGHWQVSGRSEIQEYRQRVELDLEYIRDQSIWTDFEILLRTVPSVLRRRGAY